jgi:hypothetical protein
MPCVQLCACCSIADRRMKKPRHYLSQWRRCGVAGLHQAGVRGADWKNVSPGISALRLRGAVAEGCAQRAAVELYIRLLRRAAQVVRFAPFPLIVATDHCVVSCKRWRVSSSLLDTEAVRTSWDASAALAAFWQLPARSVCKAPAKCIPHSVRLVESVDTSCFRDDPLTRTPPRCHLLRLTRHLLQPCPSSARGSSSVAHSGCQSTTSCWPRSLAL